MKQYLLLLFILFALRTPGQSQPEAIVPHDKRPPVYFEAGAGKGNFSTLKFGLNAIVKEKHSVSLLAYANWKAIDYYPADYTPGKHAGIEPGKGYPVYSLVYGAATYGRIIKMDNMSRFNLKAGIAAGSFVEPGILFLHREAGCIAMLPTITTTATNSL
ncbi:MAG: hypothetical protein EOP51_12825 [Sphingobacteriales bacterium]|nr:MAG: hypothetical protein EOP51_12825 [Sphingobacteriales bacterium]